MAGRVELSVVAKNQASKVLKQVGGDIRGLSKEAGNAKSSFNEMFSVAGGNLLARGIQGATSAVLGLGKAFVGTIADAANASAQMNAQVSGIGAVLGLTQTELVKVKDLINQLGVDPNLKVNAQEAADAIDMLARNGLTLEQILGGAAEATVFLANATGGTFATSANVATDVMAMFKIGAEDMMTAVNGITSVTTASKFDIDDYNLALAQGGGVAAALGVELTDFNTTLVATASAFAGGSDAGTSFKTFLQRLVPQSNEAAEAMAELGLYNFNTQAAMAALANLGIKPLSSDMNGLLTQLLGAYAATNNVNVTTEEGIAKFNAWAQEVGFVQSAFYDTNGALKSMADISSVLAEATSGLTELQKNQYLSQIFQSDAMRTAFGLAEKGAVVYTDLATASKELGVSESDLTKYMEGGITAFEALQATMSKTDALASAQMRVNNLAGDMDIFSGIVDSVRIQIGDKFDPVLRNVFQGLTATFTQLTPQFLAFGDVIANTVAAGVERLSNAFKAFMSGGGIADIGKALGISPGVITVIGTVIQHIDLLKGALKGVAAVVGAGVAIAGATAAITGLLNPMTLVIAGAALLGAAWETNFGGIRDITNDVAKSIGGVLASVQDFLTGADVSAATTALTQSFTNVKSALGELFSGDIGIAEFTGKISDAVSGIPAMVSSVFSGADFSAVKGEIVTALGLDNVSFDLGALQTNISNAISAIDWSQVATQFSALKDSIGIALNSVRDGILSSLTSIINGINWPGISFSFAGMIDNVASTINGIDWSQISIADIGIALVGVVAPVLTNSIRGIAWVLNSDSWAGLATAVKSALTSIQWGEIGQSFLGLGTAIINAVTGLDWSAIDGTFETLKTSIVSAVSDIDWSAITGTFETLKTSIVSAVSDIDWTGTAQSLNGLATAASAGVASIDWSGVSSAFGTLKTTVSNTLTGINWSELSTNFVASANTLRDNLIQSLADKINNIDWSQIGLNVAGFINQMASTISSIDWSQMGVNFAGFLLNISNKINSIDWSQISVGEIGAALGAVVAPALTAGIASIVWVLSSENLSNLTSAVSGAIAEIDWGAIGEAFGNLKTAVSDSISSIDWSLIRDAFSGLGSAVVDAIANIDWSGVSTPFYELKDSIQNAVNSALSTISFGLLGSSTVGNNATGTDNWKGGWTWVGERGPELLNLPKGSQVLSNTESKKMIGQLADGTTTAAAVTPKGGGNVFAELLSWTWPSMPSFTWPSLPSFTWPSFPSFAWPSLPTFSWPSMPTFAWPDYSAWSWPNLPSWAWPALPAFTWPSLPTFTWPSIPMPAWVSSLLSWNPLGGIGGLATGTDNWKGGWTWVGERGPELLNLPKGSQVLSNTESKKMIGQLADGTTTAAAATPKGGGNVFAAISAAAANMGRAGDKMSKAGQIISDSIKDLEANLRKVPGLFGASQVTKQQMEMAELGIPQNFADDWLRRLTDEVVNGVNWEGVDIKDAALRAGLDPGLPAQAILELVTQKWNDKSLFANAANLDLINQDAVKAALEAQAQQAAGEQNLLGLFGVTPEQARTAGTTTGAAAGGGMLTGITQSLTSSGAGQQVATSIATGVTPESMAPVGGSVVTALATELGKEEYGAQMGAALAGLFTGYLDKADAFADVAQRIMSKIAAQFSNVGALDMIARFVESFRAQLGSEEAIASLTAVGEKILELVFRGYLDEALRRNWAEGVNAKGATSGGPSSGNGNNSGSPTTTAGNAIGTSSWRGGMTWVGETGPELVSLPPRTRIFNPAESMALAGGGGGDVYVTINATVADSIDVQQMAYRVADILRKRR